MKQYKIIFGFIMGFILIHGVSLASKAYVTDSFEVTLRTGPNISNKIILLPKSGQALEVIGEEDEWSHVRFLGKDGSEKEGWIQTRYLIKRPPWQLQAETLSKQNASLKVKMMDTEKQRNNILRQKEEITQQLTEITRAQNKLQNQYNSLKQGAANYLKTKEALEKTQSELKKSQSIIRELTKKNQSLKLYKSIKWFATGAIVILCGWVIGLFMGRQQKKRKPSLLR
jgi:SH3 domain protein